MERRSDNPHGGRPPGTGSGAVEPAHPGETELEYEVETDPVGSPRADSELDTVPEGTTRPKVQMDPSLDQPARRGLSGGTWIALILGAVVLVLLLIFILQNNVEAQFAYFGWNFSLPLGIAMLFAAIAGVLVMGLFGSVRLIKLGHRVRRLEKERKAIKAQLR
ncbi:lipopolysaccharide assembly LapA domain-containing protein [Citricoccus sp. GCM10030269]|uniref:LapA family protein n=1 Tax=Citricoccus sp. GCM10030269 TaxID=3273388 RepID=UPI0036075342